MASALLIMDVQPEIVGRFGSDDGYLTRLGAAAAAARGPASRSST
jgi:hypothetical protein